MIREAGPADRADLEALHLRRIDGAMFPKANLRAHGLGAGGFKSNHDHAIRVWRVGDDNMLALTRGGMLLPLPVVADARRWYAALSGQVATGAVGPATSVRPVLDALDLADLPTRPDEDEPGFALHPRDLRMPGQPGARLVPVLDELRPLPVDWRATATIETQAMPADSARAGAAADVEGLIAGDSHRLLFLKDQRVALTGFNATLPESVQVGGVCTPPAFRYRGHARKTVALHIAKARAARVLHAVRFPATAAAARTDQAIGFQPALAFAQALFTFAVTVAT